jgi:hypothetical protein
LSFTPPQTEITPRDERLQNKLRDFTTIVLTNSEPIKLGCYVGPLLLLLVYVNNLRLDAKHAANVALARQLESESELLQAEALDRQLPSLLAVEAIRRWGKVEVDMDRTFRKAIELLPRKAWSTKQDSVEILRFSSDGQYLIAGGRSTAQIFESQSGKQISRIAAAGEILALALTSDGRCVATATFNGHVQRFEVTSGEETSGFIVPWRENTAMAFSSDVHLVLAGRTEARVFETATGIEVSRLRWRGYLATAAFSPDSRFVALGMDPGGAALFETASGKEITRLTNGGTVVALAFSPDGRYVATGSNDDTARLFET